jgi:hypothetical protein
MGHTGQKFRSKYESLSLCTIGNYIRCLLRTGFLAVHTRYFEEIYLLSKKGTWIHFFYRVAIREDRAHSVWTLDCYWKEAHHFSRVVLFSSNTASVMYSLLSYQKVTVVLYLFSLLHFLPSVWSLHIQPAGKGGKGAKYDDRKKTLGFDPIYSLCGL